MKIRQYATPLLLCCAMAQAAPMPAGVDYQIGFSPDQGALDLVLQSIRQARVSLEVAAYSFTSKPVAAALLDAWRRGVKVALVADQKANSRGYSAVHYLADAGVPVRLDDHYAIMHDKFMVIDGVTLETGSFNYTAAAAKANAENVLVLHNVRPLATRYAQEWQRLWQESTPLPKAY
jgi:phosphatidylserine/phosphatidylglycerophosphate/cardiolipin synthase-like enzyme